MNNLTPEQRDAYIKEPYNCPYCHEGPDCLQGKAFDHESGSVYQAMKCNACDRTWTDVYNLTTILEDEEEPKS